MNILKSIKNKLLNLSLFNKNDKEKRFINALNNHCIGDVIWALRYDFDWDKDSISEGHQQGPYVVIGAYDDKLLCLYCTGNDEGAIELDDYRFFYKKTYVKKSIKLVDSESYLDTNYEHNNKLNEKDLNKILKSLKYSSKETYKYSYFGEKREFKPDFDIELEVGDIVKTNKYYSIIVDKNNNDLIGISFNQIELEDGSINYAKTLFNFRNRYIIDSNKVEYVNSLNEKDFNIIINKYKEYMNRKQTVENNSIIRGCVISFEDKLYFVYHTDGYIARAFNVKRVQGKTNKTSIFNNGYYELNFDSQIEIDNKKDNYKVLYVLRDEEIENIILKKKNDSKKKKEAMNKLKNKNQNKKEEKNILSFGNIIKSTKLFSLRYIVLGVVEESIITISFESFLAGNIVYKIFDINDESLIDTKDYNKYELKKVRDNFAFLNEVFSIKAEEIKMK